MLLRVFLKMIKHCSASLLLFLALLLFYGLTPAYTQPNKPPATLFKQTPLSPGQIQRLLTVKEIPEGDEAHLKTSLPSQLDNSLLPYMRPVFRQCDFECSQAAGVGYAFAYEINRLRNVSATTENQYPTHFIYNFQNGGNHTAIDIAESWEIMKTVGSPNVMDYKGMYTQTVPLFYITNQYWINGYEKYSHALNNQVSDYYMIKVGTPAGLIKLKHWLYDHLEGSSNGGLANFYAELPNQFSYFPANTPQGGKQLISLFYPNTDHCMTLVGYNDSIRFDYNQDGYYSNDIDITNDGIVDMKDWEIGGLRFVNSYGPDWAENGYCYMMYRSLALSPQAGGIWNNCVFVVKPKAVYNPLVTFKVCIQHNKRNQIRLSYGISNNPTDSVPEIQFVYPILNFQGGGFGMQGGPLNFDKPMGDYLYAPDFLEFGVDVTKLLSYVEAGQNPRFFREAFPTGLTLSSNGVFSGDPGAGYTSYQIPVQVTDQQKLSTVKTLSLLVMGSNTTGDVQNYDLNLVVSPNPFHEQINFSFIPPQTGKIIITITDIYGRLVRCGEYYSDAAQSVYQFSWDGKNEKGKIMPAGIYFFYLKFRQSAVSAKIIRL